jgi:hypothetical protein
MLFFKDEKENKHEADNTAQKRGMGGSGREIKKRGTLYDHANVRSTSLQNLKDAIDTFKKGR